MLWNKRFLNLFQFATFQVQLQTILRQNFGKTQNLNSTITMELDFSHHFNLHQTATTLVDLVCLAIAGLNTNTVCNYTASC